jgi:hypothetical protein
MKGHGWWHLFSGVGAYYLIQGAMCKSYDTKSTLLKAYCVLSNYADLGVCITTSPDAYNVKWDFLPYIVPNPKHLTAVGTVTQDVKTRDEKVVDL